jgi:hypothetical protein
MLRRHRSARHHRFAGARHAAQDGRRGAEHGVFGGQIAKSQAAAQASCKPAHFDEPSEHVYDSLTMNSIAFCAVSMAARVLKDIKSGAISSLQTITAYVEPVLASANPDDKSQFERHGYCVADRVDNKDSKAVFKKFTELKDIWAKWHCDQTFTVRTSRYWSINELKQRNY